MALFGRCSLARRTIAPDEAARSENGNRRRCNTCNRRRTNRTFVRRCNGCGGGGKLRAAADSVLAPAGRASCATQPAIVIVSRDASSARKLACHGQPAAHLRGLTGLPGRDHCAARACKAARDNTTSFALRCKCLAGARAATNRAAVRCTRDSLSVAARVTVSSRLALRPQPPSNGGAQLDRPTDGGGDKALDSPPVFARASQGKFTSRRQENR